MSPQTLMTSLMAGPRRMKSNISQKSPVVDFCTKLINDIIRMSIGGLSRRPASTRPSSISSVSLSEAGQNDLRLHDILASRRPLYGVKKLFPNPLTNRALPLVTV